MALLAPRRNNQLVPSGRIEIDPNAAPRGLTFSLLCNRPNFVDLVGGRAPIINGSPLLAASPLGPAMTPNGGWLAYSMATPTTYSMEALVIVGATGGGIGGWNNNATNSSGTDDRSLGTASVHGGAPDAYVYDGNPEHATGGSLTANRLTHFCATSNGSLLVLYLDGFNVGSIACGNGYAGYTTPYLIIGSNETGSTWPGQILLFNMASVGWSAAEVQQRYLSPFAMFRSTGGRRSYAHIVASATLAETISSTSATSATLKRSRALAETISAVSLQSATIHKIGAIAEAVASVSLQAAIIHKIGAIAEAVASISSISATLTRLLPITETIAATSTISATIHKIGAINGTVASVSAVGATLTRRRPITATIAATSAATATIDKGGVLAATVAASSTLAGTLNRTRPLAETVASSSVAAGTLGRTRPLAETVAANSTITGTLNRTRSITTGVASSSAVGVTLHRLRPLSATIAATSAVGLTPHKIGALRGGYNASSILAASLGRSRPLAISLLASTSLSGTVSNVRLPVNFVPRALLTVAGENRTLAVPYERRILP